MSNTDVFAVCKILIKYLKTRLNRNFLLHIGSYVFIVSILGSGTSGQRQRGPKASSRGKGGGTGGESTARYPTSEIAFGLFVPELRNVSSSRPWNWWRRPSRENESAISVHHQPGQTLGYHEHGQTKREDQKSTLTPSVIIIYDSPISGQWPEISRVFLNWPMGIPLCHSVAYFIGHKKMNKIICVLNKKPTQEDSSPKSASNFSIALVDITVKWFEHWLINAWSVIIIYCDKY